ncbi:MAG: hypothetical protein AB7T38_12660 [Nitrospirales bacterium]
MAPIALAGILEVSPAIHARADDSSKTQSPDDSNLLNLVQDDLEFLQEETVSIASRYEQPIFETSVNEFVIAFSACSGHGSHTDDRGGFNMSVQGKIQLVSNKLLVQIHGGSILIDAAATVDWRLLSVILPAIKRSEIVKGPASFIHAFSAFEEVINITTKFPQEKDPHRVQFIESTVGLLGAKVSVEGSQKQWGYRFSLAYIQNHHWPPWDGLAFHDHQANLGTEYDLGEYARFSAADGGNYAMKFDEPTGATAQDNTQVTQGYVHGGYHTANVRIQRFWNSYPTSDDFVSKVIWDCPVKPEYIL